MAARGSRLHRSPSPAPCQQHRGRRAMGHSATTGRRITFPRPTRWGDFSHCISSPGFRLMYAAIGMTAEHFRGSFFKELRKAVNDYDRQVLLRPGFEAAFCEMSAECFAQGSEGLVRDAELLYRQLGFRREQIERRVHMWQGTDDRSCRFPSTRRWRTECPERCGIRSREPAFCGHRFGGRSVRNRGRGTGRVAITQKYVKK